MGLEEKLFKYVKYEKAREIAIKSVNPLGIEEVSLLDSVGRVLAEDLRSGKDVPERDVSLFDGYAIKSSDTKGASYANPVRLKVLREIYIGEEPGELNRGEAAYVATDAYLPKGADTVIPVEAIPLKNGCIEVKREVKPAQHVLSAGADVKKGDVVLKKGSTIAPQDIELIPLIGLKKIRVYKRPRVGLLPVGDELSYEYEENKKLEVRHLILSLFLERNGAEGVKLPISSDNPDEVKKAILNVIEKIDVLVTIGGASIGKKDPVWKALKGINGFSGGFRGIMMKPGRVTSLGWIRGKPVVLMPGHFQSMIVGTIYVLLPIVRKMVGLDPEAKKKVADVKLSKRVEDDKFKSFRKIVFVKIVGEKRAIPLEGKSFCRKPIVSADGFIEIPEGEAHLEEGSIVSVFTALGMERMPF